MIRPTPSPGWDAEIFIRNHASAWDNRSYTSFFTSSVATQRARTTNAQGTAVINDEPSHVNSGLVVPNLDSSVVVVAKYGGQPAGYSGIAATNVKDGVIDSPAWEQADRTLYVPLVKEGYVNRWSEIYVTNAGTRATTISITYYPLSGGAGYSGGNYLLQPNIQRLFSPGSGVPDGVYSAIVTNSENQPLAAVVLEGEGSGANNWPAMYNAFSSGGTTLLGPLIKKNYVGNTTGITLMNIGSSTANFEAKYYDMSGNKQGNTVSASIPANAPYVLYNPSEIPDGFLGSVRITSSQPLVGQMSEGNGSGGLRLMSNLFPAPPVGSATIIHLPIWYDNYTTGGSWMSGVNVQNAGTGINNITATWFNQNGYLILTRTATLANTNDSHNFYELPELNNFIGSVVIESTSNKPIVAVSNVRNWAGTVGDDSVMAFNGSNR